MVNAIFAAASGAGAASAVRFFTGYPSWFAVPFGIAYAAAVYGCLKVKGDEL